MPAHRPGAGPGSSTQRFAWSPTGECLVPLMDCKGHGPIDASCWAPTFVTFVCPRAKGTGIYRGRWRRPTRSACRAVWAIGGRPIATTHLSICAALRETKLRVQSKSSGSKRDRRTRRRDPPIAEYVAYEREGDEEGSVAGAGTLWAACRRGPPSLIPPDAIVGHNWLRIPLSVRNRCSRPCTANFFVLTDRDK